MMSDVLQVFELNRIRHQKIRHQTYKNKLLANPLFQSNFASLIKKYLNQ